MRALALCFLLAGPMFFGPSLVAQTPDSTTRRAVADTLTVARQPLSSIRIVAPSEGYATPHSGSATRTDTRLRDVPQSITVVTRSVVRDAGMQGMGDVVRLIPGVTMGQGEGNRDQPTIRGNNTTADFFVNGVRDDAQYFRDFYNVERLEAIKGSNAMIFGRGGGGGVLNRVMKEAGWRPVRELAIQAGSFENRRMTADIGAPLSLTVATRLNALLENSGTFRSGVIRAREGVNPTATFASTDRRTTATVGYEYFADRRTADRGIPSFRGAPLSTAASTFFGDPDDSRSSLGSHQASAHVVHYGRDGYRLSSRIHGGLFDKYYQNVFPGAVNALGDRVSLVAYNQGTRRASAFSQTELVFSRTSGGVTHTLLAGVEAGWQRTDNARQTGYFDNTSTSMSVPVASPAIAADVTYRPSVSDPDNHVANSSGSLYFQDQLVLSRRWQAIAGARVDRFDVRYRNNRAPERLSRVDLVVSPRAGLIFKPAEALSVYASRSMSYLPSAGDQFSSLTDVTRGLEPEQFRNSELGVKWDATDRLALTLAGYRLDRTNSRAPDPTDAARTVQTGRQRSQGLELSATGEVTSRWHVVGGFTRQDARILSTTANARTGSRVPLVPKHSLTLWNRYALTRALGVGLGVVRQGSMFAAFDNSVTLPAYTELDGALFLVLRPGLRAQANFENLGNTRYYPAAHNNNNISPGSPRAVRMLVAISW